MTSKISFHEEGETNGIDLKLIKRLWTFIEPYSRYFYISVSLLLLATILGPIRPYLSKIAIDNYITPHKGKDFVLILFMILLSLLFHSLTQFGANYLMKWIGQKALLDLRTKLFFHLENLDISYFDKISVGKLVTRVTNDIETISDVLSGGLIMIIIDFILIIAIISFMLMLNVELTILTLSVLPLLFFITIIFRNTIRKIFRKIRQSISQINSFLNEFISGILVIKLFTKEYFFAKKFDKLSTENKDLWLKTSNLFAIFFPTVEFISSIALALIIWFTAKDIFNGKMTLGIFFAFIQYAEMFFRPIRDLTEKFTNLQNAMASSEKIFDILEQKPKITIPPNSIPFISLKKGIEFCNVTFSYDGLHPVIQNVSFTVQKGEMVAIVGHTGSGKTTLINLLSRFYDVDNGQILIDDINIKYYDIDSFRSRISIVSQDVFLFSRDVLHNILMDGENISKDSVDLILNNLEFDEFFSSLPNGIFTNVFEKGLTLSTGQRQLIAIARALIKNPEILLLDEATSSIDSHYERIINKAINQLLQGHTSIVIAHRLSTVQRADKIIVLHKGKIAETGNHMELLQKDGIYSKLYKLHFSDFIA